MKYLTSWLLAALLAAILVNGNTRAQDRDKKDDTKKDETPAQGSDYKTPKDALTAATEGLLDGDEKKFSSAVLAKNPKDQELIKALVKFVTAAQKFKTAFVAQYMDKGWDRFNDPKYDPGNGEGNTTLRLQTKMEALDAVKAAKIDEKGDTATCEIEQKSGKKKTWKFAKVKDKDKEGWLVSAETFTDGSSDVDKTIKILNGYAELLPKYQRAIGKEGITADDIDVELGKAFVKLVYGLETKPPRFDVNKFRD